jgi:hypothetical protein
MSPPDRRTRIVCGERLALTVGRGLDAVQVSFDEALESGGWVVVNADDGQKVAVNPNRVLYLQEVPA